MPDVNNILCPVDFSEFSARAYRYALSLARHYRAELFVQHVLELWQYPCTDFAPSPEALEHFYRVHRERAEEHIQQLTKDEDRVEIRSKHIIQQGMAADLILAFAQAQKIDLIVMGTHGRRGFDRLMLGSVTERVMRKASCPLLAVHRPSHDFVSPAEDQNPVHLNRIMCCSDFSEHSKRALDHAISLGAEYAAELILLHVLEDVPARTKLAATEEAAIKRLDEMIPTEERECGRISSMVRVGKAYEQIISLADEMLVDLVVMAVRGRSALDLAVFGSTTHRVLQLGHCPILVVHT